MSRRFLLAIVVLVLVTPGARAQELPSGAALPDDEAVRVGTLDNGLRYYIRVNQRPENRAELRLAVNAGSVLEDDDQLGLAHFAEHMAFNGTARYRKQELVSYLESIGMRFGADLNAYTSFDETVYMLTVPTDTGSFLATGIDILGEWASAVSFEDEEIEKERGVVLEEWRLGRGAAARMRDRILPVIFGDSRYAERLPIGTVASLQSFEPEALRRFYRTWYRPDLMAVIAVGDFDADEVEARIRERFGPLAGPPAPRERPAYTIPDHDGTRTVIATDAEATSTAIQVYRKLPPLPEKTVADYRQGLVERLWSGMLNQRLFEGTQVADPPYLGAGAGLGGLVRGADAFQVSAGVAEGRVLTGLEAVLVELERAERHGFTATELEREKASLLRRYQLAYDEREKEASSAYAGEYVRAFLEAEPIPGIATEHALVERFLPTITLEEINALAADRVGDGNRVIALQAPAKEDVPLPAEADLLAVFEQARAAEVEPYEDSVRDDVLVTDVPTPGAIVEEIEHGQVGITEWRLDNGVRVFLKPTDFKDDELRFQATSPGGYSLIPDSLLVSASFGPVLAGVSGLGNMSQVELGKVLADKAALASPSFGDLTEGMGGGASPRDVETLFQLIHLQFTGQRADSVMFQSVKARIRPGLENRGLNPEQVFADTIGVTMAQHHRRARPITVADLDAVRMDVAHAFVKDRLADASDFTFAFAGAFELDTMRPLVEQWLATLPSLGRVEEGRDVGIRPPEGVVERIVHRGVEPKAQTRLIFHGPFEDSRENRHVMSTLRSVLDIVLREAMREEQGGTYGVSVAANGTAEPYPHYQVSIGFGSDPDRVDELLATAFAEMEKLATEGPDAATLTNVKEIQRRSHETALEQNAYWISAMLSAARRGEAPTGPLDYLELVESVTAEQVREAARRYLNRGQYARFTLLPEAPGLSATGASTAR
jgi:zinc protease